MVDYAATTVYNYTDYPVDGKIKFFTDADGFKWVKWNEGKRGQAGHVVIPKASIRRIQYLDRCQL
jgi:hypothetical protein